MKTIAAVLREINKPLVIEELILPELQQGQVLVKIAYSGICHSQLNEIQGLKGEDKFLPHVLGHEGSGVVEKIGAGVTKVAPGDHVVLTWIKGSGLDVMSSKYLRSDGSVVNSGAIATFLTRAVISENRLVKIPEKMPLREAALLGCAIPTGAGIVMNTLNIKLASSIAIFGMGGIGLSVLLAAKMKGAATIIAIDINDLKLKQAMQMGATHCINVNKQEVLPEILKITNRAGVDYAVESAGRKESMENAFQSVRDKGGVCVIAGNLPEGQRITINPFDLIKGKKIIGTWGGETKPDRDILLQVDWFLTGKLNFDKLICGGFSLREINKAINYAEQNALGRVLINMDKILF